MSTVTHNLLRVNIDSPRFFHLDIVLDYNPSKSNALRLYEAVENTVVNANSSRTMVKGDFNLDAFKTDEHESLAQLMGSCNFFPLE